MTTQKKLIDQAKRHLTPMFVRLTDSIVGRAGKILSKGSVWPAKRYSGAGTFVMIDTDNGPLKLLPEDFVVLVWRWWAPLPGDKK